MQHLAVHVRLVHPAVRQSELLLDLIGQSKQNAADLRRPGHSAHQRRACSVMHARAICDGDSGQAHRKEDAERGGKNDETGRDAGRTGGHADPSPLLCLADLGVSAHCAIRDDQRTRLSESTAGSSLFGRP